MNEYTVVTAGLSYKKANIAKSYLDEAGIESFIAGSVQEDSYSTFGYLNFITTNCYYLHVSKDNYQKALEIIENFKKDHDINYLRLNTNGKLLLLYPRLLKYITIAAILFLMYTLYINQ